MVLTQRTHNNDLEVGTKDDEFKPRGGRGWQKSLRKPLRYRKRRVLLALVAVVLLCIAADYFLRNIESPILSDESTQQRPLSPKRPGPSYDSSIPKPEPRGAPPASIETESSEPNSETTKAAQRNYNGQIKFYRLSASLQHASSTYRYKSRNVLFAFSGLKSASIVVPMACDMARKRRNYVQIAIMSRDNIPLDGVRALNGIEPADCPVFWHDARPDYNEYSSDKRAEASVLSAFGHIQRFLQPQAIVVDDAAMEDSPFVRGLRAHASMAKVPAIGIPHGQMDQMAYLTNLDSGSLNAWHTPSIDILIDVHGSSPGSLIRLLRSLQEANYSGLKRPRLILNLPSDIDSPTKRFLQGFTWTSSDGHAGASPPSDLLIIRHSIADGKISPEQASTHFLDSFYTVDARNSHVLVLSPTVQVSPHYYHYARYAILEYLHSTYSMSDASGLFGLSLQVPRTYPNGSTDFEPPTADMSWDKHIETESHADPTYFLWQAPNSNAALFTGNKWSELHSFVTHRLAALRERSQDMGHLISHDQPSWMEFALELMRVRGYYLLYPTKDIAGSLITVQQDAPEGSEGKDSRDLLRASSEGIQDLKADDNLDVDTSHRRHNTASSEQATLQPPQRSALEGELPVLEDLPRLLFGGKAVSVPDSASTARKLAAEFRHGVGQCGPRLSGKQKKIEPGSARDLFCFGDEIDSDFQDIPPDDTADAEAEVAFQNMNRASSRGVPWLPDMFTAVAPTKEPRRSSAAPAT